MIDRPVPPSRPLAVRLSGRRRRLSGQAGFTIIELIIVVAIIGILAAMAMPSLRHHPQRAKEAVLMTNLRTLRDVLDQYRGDKGYYPASLDALVDDGYMREIPFDPIADTREWDVEYEELLAEDEFAADELPGEGQPGIIDVHSTSDRLSLDGTPYNEW